MKELNEDAAAEIINNDSPVKVTAIILKTPKMLTREVLKGNAIGMKCFFGSSTKTVTT